MKEKDAYAAGLFDGEGCMRINHRIRKSNLNSKTVYHEYSELVTISQRDGRMIDWLKENYGGNCYLISRKNHERFSSEPIYAWIATNSQARNFMQKILPYLIYKKDQVAEALKLRVNERRIRQEPKELIFREEIMAEVKRLKKVYIPSTMSKVAGSTTKRINPKGM